MSFLSNIFRRKAKSKMEKLERKESIIELMCVCLSCWLLSVGTALILDSQFTIQIGIGAILWQTAAATLVVLLFSRRWWVAVIYFGILIPVFFLAVSLSGDLISFFKSVVSFFGWWFGGMSIESKWYTEQGYTLIHTCMNIGVSVMYFAISRITKKAWISVLVAIAFVVSNYAFGYTGYHILTIPFLVVGIFPLIAGEKFQNKKMPDFKNIFGVLGRKWLMVVVSSLIAVLVSLTSLFVISATNGDVRNRFCSDIVTDIQTASDTYNHDQKRINITLFDLGLATNSTFIGGDLYDIPEGVIATTNLKVPTRIKVTAFDTFNGMNWVSEFEKSYRLNGAFWKTEQNNYLSVSQAGNKDFMADLNRVGNKTNITFNIRAKTNFLPTVGQVTKFEELTRTKNPITFDSRGRLISYYGHKKDYKYTIESLGFDISSDDTESKMNAILNTYAYLRDPLYEKDSEFYKRYTKPLYEETPKAVLDAVKELRSSQYNEYQKAKKINEYFSSNKYAYVLKPDTFYRGENIVEKLFSTKRGHCVYYATAMVAMAREVGIPSRLAAGFVTVSNKKGTSQLVDLSSPYAWVECYIPNVGWMTFDPSPNNYHSIGFAQQDVAPAGDDDDKDTDKKEEEKKEEIKKVAGTNLKWSTSLNVALIVICSLTALAIILIVSHILSSQSYYKLERVRKRFKSTEKQARYYYADILRQFMWLGYRLKRGQTMRENTQKVCEILHPDNAEKLNGAIAVIEAMLYGEELPTDDQIEQISAARDMLDRIIKYRTNFFSYAIERRLLLPTVTSKTLKTKKTK